MWNKEAKVMGLVLALGVGISPIVSAADAPKMTGEQWETTNRHGATLESVEQRGENLVRRGNAFFADEEYILARDNYIKAKQVFQELGGGGSRRQGKPCERSRHPYVLFRREIIGPEVYVAYLVAARGAFEGKGRYRGFSVYVLSVQDKVGGKVGRNPGHGPFVEAEGVQVEVPYGSVHDERPCRAAVPDVCRDLCLEQQVGVGAGERYPRTASGEGSAGAYRMIVVTGGVQPLQREAVEIDFRAVRIEDRPYGGLCAQGSQGPGAGDRSEVEPVRYQPGGYHKRPGTVGEVAYLAFRLERAYL